MATSTITCTICYDDTQTPVECPYCHFQACLECNMEFIEGRISEPKCMNCRKIWMREFVLKNFNQRWFMSHIGRLIVENEKMLLPGIQEEVCYITRINEITKEISLTPTNAQLNRKYKGEERDNVLKAKSEHITSLRMEQRRLKELTYTYGSSNESIIKKTTTKVVKYIFKCPKDCRGFVSDEYICGTCNGEVCDRCHLPVLKDAPRHKCNKDDIKSAQFILQDSKACPKCMVLISRISGCNDMFCTQCNTPFDWNTLTIHTGFNSNPHYFEYLSSIGAEHNPNIERIACGEVPGPIEFTQRALRMTSASKINSLLNYIYQQMTHINRALMPRYRIDRVKDNIDLRIQFMMGEFDEDEWAYKLKNRERKRMKIKAISDLLRMTVTVLEDFVRQVYSFPHDEWFDNVHNILIQFLGLRRYFHDILDDICEIHGGKIPDDLNSSMNIFE